MQGFEFISILNFLSYVTKFTKVHNPIGLCLTIYPDNHSACNESSPIYIESKSNSPLCE
jgi:hypothetical protein